MMLPKYIVADPALATRVLFDCLSLTSHKDQLNPQLDPLP